MKKIQLFILFCVTAAFAFSSESAAMWTRLYSRIDTPEYKLNILNNIVDSDDRELVPLFRTALKETNDNRIHYSTPGEKRVNEEIQKICIKKLGEFKDLDSEVEVYAAFKDADNLVIKAESISALGRMQSSKYNNDFCTMLRNINMQFSRDVDRRENEAIVFALLTYFENTKDISAYEPIFYASVGWYSPRSGIKERAKHTLTLITNDPTEILNGILIKDLDFENKLVALETQNNSNATDEQKSMMAVQGLHEGINNKTSVVAEKMQQNKIRLLSFKMISNSSSKPDDAIPYMEEVLFNNYDTNEKLTVIETLGTYKSDAAVNTLVKYLKLQNNMQAAGMTQSIDRRTVISTINELGNMGNKAAVEELITVNTIEWPTAILKAAQSAAKKLMNP